ncbi:MAG: hypothetical protein EBU08_14590 [Micrococcales bacterium]|nr:hypothetical protein [Micrococcales bacterium]
MANPNIVGVTTITGNTAVSNVTTIFSNVITNSSGSNSVIKLNNIIVSNYSASTISASIKLNRSATDYYLAGGISIPANSTLVVVGKDTGIYMLEGDVLQANVSSNVSASLIASFESIS